MYGSLSGRSLSQLSVSPAAASCHLFCGVGRLQARVSNVKVGEESVGVESLHLVLGGECGCV